MIKINHGNDIYTQYLHLDGFYSNLKKGDYVDKNQIVGYMGDSGLATGVHLCFRLWKKKRQVNHLKEAPIVFDSSTSSVVEHKLNELKEYYSHYSL